MPAQPQHPWPPYHWPGPRLSAHAPTSSAQGRLRLASRIITAYPGKRTRTRQATRACRRHESAQPYRPSRASHHNADAPRWRAVVPMPGRPGPQRRKERPEPTGPLSLVVSVVEIFLSLTVLALIGAISVVPAAMGWVPLTVLTGSMEPGIPPGSLIVVDSLSQEEASQLQIGQVATYLPEADSDVLITHRVVGMQSGTDGYVVYQFQGDANDAPDPGWVQPKQVRGALRYHMPFVGHLLVILNPSAKTAWRTVLAGALALYALWEGVGAILERRHLKRREERRRRRQAELARQEAAADANAAEAAGGQEQDQSRDWGQGQAWDQGFEEGPGAPADEPDWPAGLMPAPAGADGSAGLVPAPAGADGTAEPAPEPAGLDPANATGLTAPPPPYVVAPVPVRSAGRHAAATPPLAPTSPDDAQRPGLVGAGVAGTTG